MVVKPWARLELGYLNHPKFLALNANAICLWHEGKNYCDSHQTDGLIPKDALKSFRFRGQRSVNSLLTSCGQKGDGTAYAALWEAHPIGFRMHDYLDYNDCREAVLARLSQTDRDRDLDRLYKQRARDAKQLKHEASRTGQEPDRPAGHQLDADRNVRLYTETETETETEDPKRKKHVSDARALAERRPANEETIPGDVWFRELLAVYPPKSVSSGHLTEVAFLDQVRRFGTPAVTFAVMLANLANHKRGYQWRVKGMIPRLDRWLRDGLWQQTHEEHPPEALVNDKTAGTLAAASLILGGKG